MREMRLAKREITDPEVLKEIVEECDTVRLGLTDAEGMFIVPVNYGYEFTEKNGKAELQLYFHGAAEGRKADALKSQSPVAVEMVADTGSLPEIIPVLIPILTGVSWEMEPLPFWKHLKKKKKDFSGSWSIWLRVQRLSSGRKC